MRCELQLSTLAEMIKVERLRVAKRLRTALDMEERPKGESMEEMQVE